MKFKIHYLFLITVFVCHSVTASVTNAEFVPCKELAVAVLTQCLDGNKSQCWEESEAQYHSCRDKVTRRHGHISERVDAEKKTVDSKTKTEKS
ncbi:hypothetical protein R1T43_09230 [Alteromonas sp. CI.11.F.A3]|uniref:hypothetical protein n=1 Tax=Alteromonas sp. CI.11.F.A3 TaxID=3079555 RepID=UPI002943D286|nr:hypothetical protein [Alteromonas sp. CI.11.F.A3]WOI39186.1 hypothetical protein R1T43_09230 [Alteromonas sp. CI.11.F.A3]